MQNAVVVETWTTHSQTRTCVVHTKREIRLPVVVVLGFRRRCLSFLINGWFHDEHGRGEKFGHC